MMKKKKLCLGCMIEKGDQPTCSVCGYDERSAPASLHHLLPGSILKNKYFLGKALGQGGFGITYLAWDTNLDVKLAIKEFFPLGLASRVSGGTRVEAYSGSSKEYNFGLELFLNEARTLALFSEHPGIVTVRDFFAENDTAYMVMNFIEGITLQEYLIQQNGPIDSLLAIQIMMPVLDALNEIHRGGILHRDISPDNIIIDINGRVLIIDFGAARLDLLQKGRGISAIIKPGYSPEEQCRASGEQGPWTDIYAVAATFYQLITGHLPPESLDRLAEDRLKTPSALGVNIEQNYEKVLLKALSVHARDRFQTVAEFQRALGAEKKETASIWMVEESEAVASNPEINNGKDQPNINDSPIVTEDEIENAKADNGQIIRTPSEKPDEITLKEELSEPFCSNCNFKLIGDEAFCPQCGQKQKG